MCADNLGESSTPEKKRNGRGKSLVALTVVLIMLVALFNAFILFASPDSLPRPLAKIQRVLKSPEQDYRKISESKQGKGAGECKIQVLKEGVLNNARCKEIAHEVWKEHGSGCTKFTVRIYFHKGEKQTLHAIAVFDQTKMTAYVQKEGE